MRQGNSLCQVCDDTAQPGAPLPLCKACLVAAYRYVKACVRTGTPSNHDRLRAALTGADVPDSVVYYIRAGDRVKIGTSRNAAARAKALSLRPDSVVATEPGGRSVEAARHQQFAALRLQGEWFLAGPDLLAHIAALRPAAA